MGDNSPIEWTDATWNPTVGCKRVSAGCDHCYAFQLHDQRHIAWKRGRFPDAPAQYHKPFSQVQLMPDRLDLPRRWRKPRMVFVNSMSDLFHVDVPDEFVDAVWRTMAQTPQHTYQILTKRPERMRAWVRERTGWRGGNVLPNVWLGTSVEHQAAADERIPLLMDVPAAVRFLSCEPLLGPVDLRPYLMVDGMRMLDWVIVGGESGPHYRAMNLDWARSLRDQCNAAGVPFFYKQAGGRTPKAGGRELDGRTWDEMPAAPDREPA